MRIGLFTHVYPPMTNGIAVSVNLLEKELQKRGHEVFIITNNFSISRKCFDNRILLASVPIFYQNLRTPILFDKDILEEIDKLDLDVVHSHSDFGLDILSKIYSSVRKIPNIKTFHCNYEEYAKENFGMFFGKVCREPIKIYSHLITNKADRLVSPSYANYELLKDNYGIKRNIDIIPNGIDLEIFKSRNDKEIQDLKIKYGIKKEDFVLLMLSRLSKEKRIDEVIKIMPYFKKYHNLKLLIVGTGPEEKKLKKLANDLEVNNVIFTGEVNHDKVCLYYQLGTVFINNSIAETQGLTVIEALASSLPVICIKSPLYESILKKSLGIEFNKVDDLINLIEYFYYDISKLNEIRENTLLGIKDFSIKTTTNKYEQIYEEEIFKCKVRKK